MIFFVCVLSAALQVVFGSLYRDDVLIKPSRVVSILAAACMLQLVSVVKSPPCLSALLLRLSVNHMGCYHLQDGLIQQCGETMKENISTKTVCGYYACASIYGLDSVMKKSE